MRKKRAYPREAKTKIFRNSTSKRLRVQKIDMKYFYNFLLAKINFHVGKNGYKEC